MWRLPVVHARDPDESLRILRVIAHQAASIGTRVLRRSDRKPKRTTSRRLHLLQGLPGIGRALANRLLLQLGSIERMVLADEPTLMEVRGLGRIKAARIRELVRSSA